MEVILLERVAHLGNLGDQVKVKAGFGRNFLVPQGKAVPANKDNRVKFEERRAELEAKAAKVLAAAQARADKISGTEIKIKVQSSDEGKLYGSVGTKEIADHLNEKGHEVQKHEVLMPNGVIRSIGIYDIDLLLYTDVKASIKLFVQTESGETEVKARVKAETEEQPEDNVVVDADTGEATDEDAGTEAK